jgi:hypothetical protein
MQPSLDRILRRRRRAANRMECVGCAQAGNWFSFGRIILSSLIAWLSVAGGNAFHFDLLTTDRVADCLDVIGAGLADDHFFCDASGLRDDGLLCRLEYFHGCI